MKLVCLVHLFDFVLHVVYFSAVCTYNNIDYVKHLKSWTIYTIQLTDVEVIVLNYYDVKCNPLKDKNLY